MSMAILLKGSNIIGRGITGAFLLTGRNRAGTRDMNARNYVAVQCSSVEALHHPLSGLPLIQKASQWY